MKKEVILAIIIGFGIGLLITFGIYTAKTALEKQESITQTQEEESQTLQTPSPSPNSSLAITSPPNEFLSDTDSITLEGKTTTEATLAIISEEEQQIITADKQGDFKATVELSGGINQINISSFNQEGEKTETNLTIIYSTAEI